VPSDYDARYCPTVGREVYSRSHDTTEIVRPVTGVLIRARKVFREFDGVVLVCCLGAFIFWVHAAWALGERWLLRILRCTGALVASVVIFLLLAPRFL